MAPLPPLDLLVDPFTCGEIRGHSINKLRLLLNKMGTCNCFTQQKQLKAFCGVNGLHAKALPQNWKTNKLHCCGNKNAEGLMAQLSA